VIPLILGVLTLLLFWGRAELAEFLCVTLCRCRRDSRDSDPCRDAALAFVRKNRPSLWRRAWAWYKRVTGYEPNRSRPFGEPSIQAFKRCHCGLCDFTRFPGSTHPSNHTTHPTTHDI